MSTYRELLSQLDKLKKEIEEAREQEAHLIAERVAELLAESGIPVRDFQHQNRQDRRQRAPVRPKYWDPKTGATWSGRGRTPRWLVGKDIEQFRIDCSVEERERSSEDRGTGERA
ncbi:H-NS histone family protein [Burkholderia sp. 4701]|nr:H-NS histone family protein [Burkholderia sp. 4701]MXN86972.1 H-NS histone family protein [Burkholderia sp. 4812]